MKKLPEPEVERVMVIPDASVKQLGLEQGFNAVPEEVFTALTDQFNVQFLPRPLAEEDESYRQLIPYAIFHNGQGVLVYRRVKGSAEQRLMGRYSIGFGGHINDEDSNFRCGVERELFQEELYFPLQPPRLQYRGLLLDDSNPVGRVHLGVVYVAEIPLPNFTPTSNDPKIQVEGFINPEHLWAMASLDPLTWPLDPWTSICLVAMDQLVPGLVPDLPGHEMESVYRLQRRK